ncbi:hypothetical protein HY411_01010 [Candidatus Gottesmanbacteria bacterium]|nr:hypothetical protein [Candidatus Gottesmanbacteria bacterium]
MATYSPRFLIIILLLANGLLIASLLLPQPTHAQTSFGELRRVQINQDSPNDDSSHVEGFYVESDAGGDNQQSSKKKSIKELVRGGRLAAKLEKRKALYEQFLVKVKTRRDKLTSDGKDVSALNTLITNTETKISSLTESIAATTQQLTTVYGQDKAAREAGAPEALTKVRELQQSLRDLNALLRQIVDTIRTLTVSS